MSSLERANELSGVLTKVNTALSTWQGHQATIFNGVHVWSGDASKAAGAAVESATKAMQNHARQLGDAIAMVQHLGHHHLGRQGHHHLQCHCGSTGNSVDRKTAAKNNQNPDGAIQTLVQREYKDNAGVVNTFAMAWGAKPGDLPLSPADEPRQSPTMIRPLKAGRVTTREPGGPRPRRSRRRVVLLWMAASVADAAPPAAPPAGLSPAASGLDGGVVADAAPRPASAPSRAAAGPRVRGRAASNGVPPVADHRHLSSSPPAAGLGPGPAGASRAEPGPGQRRRAFGFAGHKQPQLAPVVDFEPDLGLCRQSGRAPGLRWQRRTRRRRRQGSRRRSAHGHSTADGAVDEPARQHPAGCAAFGSHTASRPSANS